MRIGILIAPRRGRASLFMVSSQPLGEWDNQSEVLVINGKMMFLRRRMKKTL